MNNVIPFQRPAAETETIECGEKASETVQRLPYSFDIVQIGENVLVDACVPPVVAMKIAQLILEHAAAADAGAAEVPAPKSSKRRSRKAVA